MITKFTIFNEGGIPPTGYNYDKGTPSPESFTPKETNMRLTDVAKILRKIDPNVKVAYGKTFSGKYKGSVVNFKVGEDNKVYYTNNQNTSYKPINESFHDIDGTPIGVDKYHRPIQKEIDDLDLMIDHLSEMFPMFDFRNVYDIKIVFEPKEDNIREEDFDNVINHINDDFSDDWLANEDKIVYKKDR